MTVPRYEKIRNEHLLSDQQVLERVRALLPGRALRRQIWLMFLDEDHRQMPIIMPSYVPRAPDLKRKEAFARVLGSIFEEVDADALILVYERRGPDAISAADRRWLRHLHDACELSGIRMRGPILCHDRGLRWVAVDDLQDP